MPSPFPGMDPYLERPALFPNLRLQMISQVQGDLNRTLQSKYLATVEERVYLSTEDDPGRKVIIPDVEIREATRRGQSPNSGAARGGTAMLDVAEPIVMSNLVDDEIHEHFLNVIEAVSKDVVAIIEILSPANKCPGAIGREKYLAKKRSVMHSDCHFVEIDLLRDGKQTFERDLMPPHHYAVHVSGASSRPKAKYWPILLRQRLPVVDIPLKDGDPDATLDLQAVFASAYEFGAYDRAIDYRKPPEPPLPSELQQWAADLIGKSGVS